MFTSLPSLSLFDLMSHCQSQHISFHINKNIVYNISIVACPTISTTIPTKARELGYFNFKIELGNLCVENLTPVSLRDLC